MWPRNCGWFLRLKACHEEIESVICDVYMAVDAQTDDDDDDDGGGGGDVNVGVRVFVCLDDAERQTDRRILQFNNTSTNRQTDIVSTLCVTQHTCTLRRFSFFINFISITYIRVHSLSLPSPPSRPVPDMTSNVFDGTLNLAYYSTQLIVMYDVLRTLCIGSV